MRPRKQRRHTAEIAGIIEAIRPCDGLSQCRRSDAARRLKKGDRRAPLSSNTAARQRPAEHGAGIEIEPIAAQIGLSGHQWRMAMNDQTTVVASIGQERLPDPQHVDGILSAKRLAGIDAGMDEKTAAVVVAQSERAHPVDMRTWKFGRRHIAVTFERRHAALREPHARRASAVDRGERHRFVIAPEQNDTTAAPRLQIDQKEMTPHDCGPRSM